jgi:hypothetical protein
MIGGQPSCPPFLSDRARRLDLLGKLISEHRQMFKTGVSKLSDNIDLFELTASIHCDYNSRSLISFFYS